MVCCADQHLRDERIRPHKPSSYTILPASCSRFAGCTADAYGYREDDHIAVVGDCIPDSSPRTRQAHILHTNGSRNGKGAYGASRAHRVQGAICDRQQQQHSCCGPILAQESLHPQAGPRCDLLAGFLLWCRSVDRYW
jgi:hypothetical protein